MKTELIQNLIASVAFVGSLSAAIFATPIIIDLVKKLDLMVRPNERSSHKIPTPSLGGLSFLPGILIGAILLPFSIALAALVACAFLLAFTGAFDDLKDIRASYKFVVQIAVATILFSAGFRIDHLQGFLGVNALPIWLSFACTLAIVVAIINAYNLTDGIDGLAGGIGLMNSMVFGFVFMLQGDFYLAILAFGFAGSLVGFLNFNLSPAKIFMGDAGSLVLGLFMAVFFLKTFAYGSSSLSSLAIAMMLFPSLDMTRLFASRIAEGLSPFKADKNHYHHLLLKTGYNHSKAAVTYFCINGVLCLCGWLFGQYLGVNLSFFSILSIGVLFYALVEIRFYLKMKFHQDITEQRIEKEIKSNNLYKTLLL
jgi:UDP-GlcNAc:undecaprenyl-phosphate GlcNAc-1-phosphate transferase